MRSTSEDVGKAQLPTVVARPVEPEVVEVIYCEYRVRLRGGAALGQQVFAKTGAGGPSLRDESHVKPAVRTRRFVL
ncbi:hypothetical protein [Shimia sp. MIT1388]|uniref:hypothetical protein n=1 Tax=Shimia sp. MIT1388 TaxID=3096992 RepID=UPI00399A595B